MAEMKTHDVLRRAADFVDQGWTQGTAARSDTGQPCSSEDSDAVLFCLVGALGVASCQAASSRQLSGESDVYFSSCLTVLRTLLKKRGELGNGKDLQAWNDNPDRKKREVVDLLLEAARAEEEADG